MTTTEKAKPRPGIDRPIQLRDLPVWKRYPLTVWLLLLGGLGGFIFVRTYAGGYFVVLESVRAIKTFYDRLIPVDWARHLFVRDEGEKGEAFITVAVIKYYFASKWPKKPPNRWDRFERYLGVANERLSNQGFHVLFLAPFWALIYMTPGFAVWGLFLWATHQNAREPLWWQILIGGLVGSFFMGNRVAQGFAYHLQRWLIRERLSHGKDKPAWWMAWPLQKRFEWEVSDLNTRWRSGGLTNLSTGTQVLRRLGITLIVLVVLTLTYIGWYVMKYHTFDYANWFQNVHFHISDLWNHVLS